MDLVENEVEVAPDEVHPDALGDLRVVDEGRRRRWRGRRARNRRGRRREHLLGDAVGVLVDGLDTQRQPVETSRLASEGRIQEEVEPSALGNPTPMRPGARTMSSNTPEPGLNSACQT